MRTVLWLILFIIFICIPAIEIYIFLWASSAYGILPILSMIILTGVIGMVLVRLQGIDIWQKMQKNIQQNKTPNEEIFDGLCLVLSGICLITPGFFTDALGFLLVIPLTRIPFKYVLKRLVRKMIKNGNIYFGRW